MPAVVASVPLQGPTGAAGRDAAEAMHLALEDAGAPVGLRVLDAGPGPLGPNAVANAREAAGDPDVIAYLGEFYSAASGASLPVLEAAGLPQVSYANTWLRLAGASFFNVMPTDERQAQQLVAWMRELGVRRPYLLDDGEYYGHEMRWLVHEALATAGVPVAGAEPLEDGELPPAGLAGAGADAVFVGTVAEDGTSELLSAVHAQAPDALLFSMEGLLSDVLAAVLPPDVASRLHVTAAALRGDELPEAGRAVVARLRDRLGRNPDPHAVYAYEAAALLLDALAHTTPDRDAIAVRLRGTRDRHSVLGTYDLDARGHTTLAAVGRRRVERGRFTDA
jgi:branched-chain amino acid transport system substrate-binding protein